MEWITIRTYTLPQDAFIAQTKLESEGIETFLKDEMTTQIFGFYSQAIGGVKLQVRESDVEMALQVIEPEFE